MKILWHLFIVLQNWKLLPLPLSVLPCQSISSRKHSWLGSLPMVSKKNLQQLSVWDVYRPAALPITQLQCQNTEGIDKRLSQLQS